MAGSTAILVPKVIKNFNLRVDGFGYAGLCDEVRLPDLRIKTDDHRGAAMDAPISIDVGMDKLDLGFTLSEHSPAIFRQFGLTNQNAVQVTFNAAMVDDVSATPYVINAKGMYTEQRLGTVRNGDRNRLEAMLNLRYFKLSIGGEVLIEIDIMNFVRNIGGVDQMEVMRACLGM